ncbi:MAG: glycosyltransferase [Eubacteriales bacterium]|nr:glycosyltransferase [Eubacteriales bacterium]
MNGTKKEMKRKTSKAKYRPKEEVRMEEAKQNQEKQQLDRIKIDVVSVPFSGHLYPALTLVYPLLAEEKYQIRIFTGEEKIELVKKLGFETVTLLKDKPKALETIANTSMKNDFLGSLRQFKQSTALLSDIIEDLKQEWTKNRPDIVLADFVSVVGGMACRELQIPWITCIPSPFAIESRNTTPSYLGGWKPHPGLLYQFRDAVGRQLIHQFKRLAFFLFRKNLGAYQNFEVFDENGYERIYSPYSILGLGMEEMEFRKDFPPQFRWAGYHCLSFEELTTWRKPSTAPDEKLVLLTCGSHLPWAKKELIQMAEILGRDYPHFQFLISFGMRHRKEKKPKRIRDNIWIYPYLPYHQVLPEVDYVVHHGGAGILYNCIEYGKPAVIIPRDYDQFDYAVRADMAGIAKVCKKGKAKCLRKAFSELVKDKEQKALKQMQKDWSKYKPTKVLLEEMDRLLK